LFLLMPMKHIHEGRAQRSIDPVDIRDLEYFRACCNAPSFTAAANEVHIVQTAMSHAIARLERELGAELFDRAGGRVRLTAQGAALQKAAERIISAVQAAKDDVAEAGGQVLGTVRLGSTLHTGRLNLAAVFSGIRDRHPGVVVQLRQSKAGSTGLVQEVRDGQLDIALTAATGSPHGVVLQPLFTEQMVLLMPPGHRLSRREGVTVADLREEVLLRPPPGWGTRAAIDEALGATESAFEVASYDLMGSLVRAGFATALVPASAMTGIMLAGLRTVPAEDSRLRWTLSAVVSADRRMTVATGVLLSALVADSAGSEPEVTSPAGS
jgi:DNA-binding transcriptional LysR family regulator